MTVQTFSERILALPRSVKRLIALGVDSAMCALSVWLAYYLRTNEWPDADGVTFQVVVTSIVLAIPLFIICGLYRTIFRFGGVGVLLAIVRAVIVYAIPFAFIYSYISVPGVPRTIGLLQPILLLLLVATAREAVVALLGRTYRDSIADGEKPVIVIYGAGAAGRQIASALRVSGQVKVIGFLDDDATLANSTINGLRVWAPNQVPRLIVRYGLTDVLLAMNKVSRPRRNEILADLKGSGVHIRVMPGVDELARGTVSFSELRELDIQDLLGRPSIPPDTTLLKRNITGKTVLVTGAGGSIGSEICRQIARLSPDILLLLDVSEYNLYAIHQELIRMIEGGLARPGSVVPLLASVRDQRRISEIVATWRPDTIYHAAAYKHVPLVEHNLVEGIANNVFGTLNVALAAREHGVASFVLISTDKAVRPTNVMGATKRLAEMILQALNAEGVGGRFSMVRFGNVLGSSGSVVPLFRSQIAAGGPVTITHPDITRYFMTIPEAAQLVIQAGAMAEGGDLFVLDMGDPVRIVDLARAMIELSGFRVREEGSANGDIAIKFVGLRPGEKLYEELLISGDITPSGHPRILRAEEPFIAWDVLRDSLGRLQAIIEDGGSPAARDLLQELVAEFQPTTEVVDHVTLQQEEAAANAVRPIQG